MNKNKLQMHFYKAAAALVLMLFSQTNALAWNDLGHMTVAAYAYKNLNQKSKSRSDQILKLHPLYEQWKAELLSYGVPEAKLAAHIFMLAATWPDIIKKDKSYIPDGSEAGNRPEGPDSARNIGFEDKLMHKYWHFYDKPILSDDTAGPPIPSPNALTQIAILRKTLKDKKASDSLKAYDLCWLLHLVGDTHQPLHCSTRVSKDMPYGDAGGNNVWVINPFVQEGEKPKQRLHWFWDNIVGPGHTKDAEKLADSLAEPESAKSKSADAELWAKESYELCKSKVYVGPIKAGSGPFKVNKEYADSTRSLAEKQIALAGKRLALILNSELR